MRPAASCYHRSVVAVVASDSGWTLPVVVKDHCQPLRRRRHPLLRTSIATRCSLSTATATTAAITTRTGQWWGRQRFDCWSSSICSSSSSTMTVSFSWQPMKRCNFWKAAAAGASAAAGNSPGRQFANTPKRRTSDKHAEIRKAAKVTEKPPSQQVKVPQSIIRLMFCYSKLDVEAHWNLFGDMIRQQMATTSGNADTSKAAVSLSTPILPGLQKHRKNSNVHTTTNDYDHSDDDAFDERIYKCPLHWPSVLALAQQEYPTNSKDAQLSTNTDKLQVAMYQIDRSAAATKANHVAAVQPPIQSLSSSSQTNKRPLKQSSSRAPRLEWKALKSLDDLTLGLPHGFVVANRIPILLRHPNFYQESSSQESRQKRSSTTTATTATTRMEHAVYGLLYELKETGHVRHSDCEMIKLASSENHGLAVIATSDWVLQMASKQEALQDLLLSQPGALDHIVSCLHFDYLWQQQPDEHNDSDEDNRNDVGDRK